MAYITQSYTKQFIQCVYKKYISQSRTILNFPENLQLIKETNPCNFESMSISTNGSGLNILACTLNKFKFILLKNCFLKYFMSENLDFLQIIVSCLYLLIFLTKKLNSIISQTPLYCIKYKYNKPLVQNISIHITYWSAL